MVKMVNFMLHVFNHEKKKSLQNKACSTVL